MELKNYAHDLFLSGYNCAQCVSSVFADRFSIDEDLLMKVSAGFGGGVGRRQTICGAVSGGVIALGLRYGRSNDDDPIEMKEETYNKVREFLNRFEEKMGSINCLDLVSGIRTDTHEGRARFLELKMPDKVCAPAVTCAIELLEEMLAEDSAK
jgi:C_GCAxxG_C_C family probable redox protein